MQEYVRFERIGHSVKQSAYPDIAKSVESDKLALFDSDRIENHSERYVAEHAIDHIEQAVVNEQRTDFEICNRLKQIGRGLYGDSVFVGTVPNAVTERNKT